VWKVEIANLVWCAFYKELVLSQGRTDSFVRSHSSKISLYPSRLVFPFHRPRRPLGRVEV